MLVHRISGLHFQWRELVKDSLSLLICQDSLIKDFTRIRIQKAWKVCYGRFMNMVCSNMNLHWKIPGIPVLPIGLIRISPMKSCRNWNIIIISASSTRVKREELNHCQNMPVSCPVLRSIWIKTLFSMNFWMILKISGLPLSNKIRMKMEAMSRLFSRLPINNER